MYSVHTRTPGSTSACYLQGPTVRVQRCVNVALDLILSLDLLQVYKTSGSAYKVREHFRTTVGLLV